MVSVYDGPDSRILNLSAAFRFVAPREPCSRGADRDLNRQLNVIVLPLVAAFVMTQWDFVMDAPASTISKAWIWHDGGAVFGVPLTNYTGWLLTSWIFYQVFALYLARRREVRPPRRNRALRLVAILFYGVSGLTHLTPWLMGQSGDVADATGHIWRIQDLRETTVAVMLFTMFFTVDAGSAAACKR